MDKIIMDIIKFEYVYIFNIFIYLLYKVLNFSLSVFGEVYYKNSYYNSLFIKFSIFMFKYI